MEFLGRVFQAECCHLPRRPPSPSQQACGCAGGPSTTLQSSCRPGGSDNRANHWWGFQGQVQPTISCGDGRLAWGQALHSSGRNAHQAKGMKTMPGVAWEQGAGKRHPAGGLGTAKSQHSTLLTPIPEQIHGKDVVTVGSCPAVYTVCSLSGGRSAHLSYGMSGTA